MTTDRLLGLPAYWINLERDTERAANFLADVGRAWSGPLERVNAIDGNVAPVSVINTLIDSRRAFKLKPAKASYPARTMQINRGTYGCLHSHIKALQRGLNDGHERFVIMEDDAAVRLTLLERTEDPPETAQFVGWGGLPMLGFKADDQAYRDELPQKWLSLNDNSRFYGAHCYELTHVAAEHLLAIYQSRNLSTDDAWHQLFDEVNSVRTKIQVVTQRSGLVSSINGQSRDTGAI